MRHHTTDPAKRAEDVADHEMEIAYKNRRDGGNWAKFWLNVYHESLKEFAEVPPEAVRL